jgi:5'-nucleotidase
VALLVTNDDGVEAPGLHALARALVQAGHEIVVAAPIGDRSGSGAAIGNIQPGGDIRAEPWELPDLPGVVAFGVDGPPALAVMAGRLGAFGAVPDLIVAGINPGNNTGRATLHSGTVGAALTASNFGCSAVAVSIGWAERPRWETAGAYAVAAVDWVAGAPVKTVVNLNVPDLPLAEVKGARWAELAPFGTVRVHVGEPVEGRLQVELRETGQVLPPDTDTALVEAGYAAVTLLTGIRAAPREPVAEAIERAVDLGSIVDPVDVESA